MAEFSRIEIVGYETVSGEHKPIYATADNELKTYDPKVYDQVKTNSHVDIYTRLGAPAGASLAADIAAVKGAVDANAVAIAVVDGVVDANAVAIAVVDGVVDANAVAIAVVDSNVDECKSGTRVEIDNFEDNWGVYVGARDAAANGQSASGWDYAIRYQYSMKLEVDVSASGSHNAIWDNTSVNIDLSGCTVACLWVKMPPRLDNFQNIGIGLGTSSANAAYWQFGKTTLQAGWNFLIIDLNNPDTTGGSGWSPGTNVQYIRFQPIYTSSQGDFDIYVDEFFAYKSDSSVHKSRRTLLPRIYSVEGMHRLGEGQTEEIWSNTAQAPPITVFTVPAGKVYYLSTCSIIRGAIAMESVKLQRSGTTFTQVQEGSMAAWNGSAIQTSWATVPLFFSFPMFIKFTTGQTFVIDDTTANVPSVDYYCTGWSENV